MEGTGVKWCGEAVTIAVRQYLGVPQQSCLDFAGAWYDIIQQKYRRNLHRKYYSMIHEGEGCGLREHISLFPTLHTAEKIETQ